MTLQQVIKAIENVAGNQPAVNMVVRNDVFRLNAIQDAKYGVFAWLQRAHGGNVDESLVRYRFTFFYVDRLTEDKGNEVEVQSTAHEVLRNIIQTLDNYGISSPDGYTFQTFNQRFADECAGGFCEVSLEVPAGSMCAESFADFNNDFNNDFMII